MINIKFYCQCYVYCSRQKLPLRIKRFCTAELSRKKIILNLRFKSNHLIVKRQLLLRMRFKKRKKKGYVGGV